MSAIYNRTTATGLAAATSANGTARNGANLSTDLFHPGTLAMACTADITTSSVVATFKVQVSNDGTNWFDLKLLPSIAEVTTAAGTGSAVQTYRALCVPREAQAFMLVRGVATLSGAATASADTTAITYQYVDMGGMEW